jgi:regulator of protease activity HflC (stomatin/prohibitin superfamily)
MPWASVAAMVFLVVLTSLATFLVSARLLRDFYGGSTWDAFRHQLGLSLGQMRGLQVIEDGRVVIPSSSGTLLGPRLIIIRPGNAALLVNGGRVTRVTGPRIFRSERFEFVKHVYDLQERQELWTLEKVLTNDLIPTTVKLTTTYMLEISQEARQGDTPLSDDEAHILRRLPFTMPQWPEATRSAVEQSVRQVVSSEDLDGLLASSHHRPLEQRIINLTNQRTLDWGVRIRNVIIECLQPMAEITGATSSRWIADANNVEVARAQAFKDALLIIADAYRIARDDMEMPDEAIYREVLRRTLEQLAKDPATKLVITPELRGLLGA